MAQKIGRPTKDGNIMDCKGKLINAAVDIIREKGAENVTVRNVCGKADLSIGTFYHYFDNKDDLMMHFVREAYFNKRELHTDISRIGDRISELYMYLIDLYMELGEKFMKSFYYTGNKALSAYTKDEGGKFPEDTIMARSEVEMDEAKKCGIIKADTDSHQVCADICTIIKGCVFEWCLVDGEEDIKAVVYRIINNYLTPYLA